MKVKDLLTDESKWTQRAGARNAQHKSVPIDSGNAVRWCLTGAIQKCYPHTTTVTYLLITTFLLIPNGFLSIVNWNDDPHRKFEDIRQMIETLDI